MLYFYKPVLYRAFFDIASKVNEAMDIDSIILKPEEEEALRKKLENFEISL